MVQLAWGLCPNTGTQTEERAANAVELTFYRAQVDTWTSEENSAKVAVLISNQAQTTCSASAATCGLDTCCSSAFKETDVGTVASYPQNSRKDMKLKIYVDIPSDINATASPYCVLSTSVLMSLVEDAREAIHTETGHWITYVNEEFYGIPPSDLNAIITPIAFAILLILAGLTLGLNLWKKKKDSDSRRMKIIEDRKKHSKSKVNPTYNIESDPTKVPPGVDGQNKDQLYKDGLRQKKTDSRTSGNAVADSEPYQRQGYAYERKQDLSMSQGGTLTSSLGATGTDSQDGDTMESGNALPPSHLTPLQTQSTPDTEAPEKKKKKKKKRSKSKENMRTQENPAYDDSDYTGP